MFRLIKITFVLALITLGNLSAQQLPLYSQYMLNNYVINPAVTGMYDYYKVNSNFRNQWVGITDAPRTYILNLHGPQKNKNYGLGGSVFADITGPTSRTGLAFSYAYHFQLTQEQKISLGMSAGVLQFSVDGSKISMLDQGDLALTNTVMSAVVPDFGFGAYWYNDEKYYVGVSVPQFIQNRLNLFEEAPQTLSRLTSHYFINGGYRFDLNETFSLEPSMLIKYSHPTAAQFDIGSKFTYDQLVYLGLVYRTEDAMSVLVGFNTPDNRFSFGYAYDITTSNVSNYSSGTHEIMIAARFGEVKSSRKSSGSKSNKSSLQEKLRALDEEVIEESGSILSNEEIEAEIAALEEKDLQLRNKISELRNQAKEEGFDNPEDENFSGNAAYQEAMDEVKAIFKRKQDLEKQIN